MLGIDCIFLRWKKGFSYTAPFEVGVVSTNTMVRDTNNGDNKEKDLEFLFEDDTNEGAQEDVETAKLEESESSSSDDEGNKITTQRHSFTSQQWPQSYKYTLLLYRVYKSFAISI